MKLANILLTMSPFMHTITSSYEVFTDTSDIASNLLKSNKLTNIYREFVALLHGHFLTICCIVARALLHCFNCFLGHIRGFLSLPFVTYILLVFHVYFIFIHSFVVFVLIVYIMLWYFCNFYYCIEILYCCKIIRCEYYPTK